MNFKIEMAPTVSWTEVEGQTVLFSKATGDIYGMNATGAYLVQELLKSDFTATVAKCAKDFEVSESQIAGDLKELVDALAKVKLVTPTPVARLM